MNLFLSAGAMKAGTTWLYSHLRNHKDLYFTPEKEIHFLYQYYLKNNFLGDGKRFTTSKNAIERLNTEHLGIYKMHLRWYAMYLEKPDQFQWYARVFSLNRNKKYNCDFSNLTCHIDKKNWSDLKSKVNTLKVIYILRDPIKRYWSHIKFHYNKFLKQGVDFSTWNEDQFNDFFSKDAIVSNGNYAKHLSNMQSSLSQNEFKLCYFEDMTIDPLNFLNNICNFLNIEKVDKTKEELMQAVNPSEKKEMPSIFINYIKPLVQNDLEALSKLNIEPHKSWTVV